MKMMVRHVKQITTQLYDANVSSIKLDEHDQSFRSTSFSCSRQREDFRPSGNSESHEKLVLIRVDSFFFELLSI